MSKISLPLVFVFYTLMTLLGCALAYYWGDFNVLKWSIGGPQKPLLWQVLAGFGVGVLVVIISHVLEYVAEWARALGDGLKELMGPLSPEAIAVVALCSGVGEEVLFRGFLMQMLAVHAFSIVPDLSIYLAVGVSSLLFGAMHVGPDWRRFWPWTVLAVLIGAVFGALFVWTGTLLAPILAHLTINFLNLTLMNKGQDVEGG